MTALVPSLPASGVRPWYRHRWPWLLMAGPAIVVVAGLFTAWLAVRSDDGLVADDYYKRGLLINREIEKTERSAGIEARLAVAADGAVRLDVAGLGRDAPPTMRLRFANATRAGLDRTVALARMPDGSYAGSIAPLSPGRWLATLETDAWRLPPVEVTAPAAEIRFGAPDPR